MFQDRAFVFSRRLPEARSSSVQPRVLRASGAGVRRVPLERGRALSRPMSVKGVPSPQCV